MKSLLEYSKELRQMYEVEKKSLRQVAKVFNSYPLAVYRALIEIGVKVRDKSDAAKEALESGRAIHPTKGKKIPAEIRDKIGKSVSETWNEMSEDKKQRISEKHKKIWEEKSDSDKAELSKKSHQAIAESSRLGSKLERFLYRELNNKGYDCYQHLKVLENQNLEVDLTLPDLKIAIELDGPTHYSPIWGDEVFRKTQEADKEKNGLLILNGYKVIRIIYTKGHVSNVLQQAVLKELVDKIEHVKVNNDDLTYINF